jgi:modification methylase
MITTHKFYNQNSNNLKNLFDNSVQLVVTSPPYPMIEMWDEIFTSMNSEIQVNLVNDPQHAFELMHQQLDTIWKELFRVVADGCFVVINIGDATRTIGEKFQIFMNGARIIRSMTDIGFITLPEVIWRKQTNAPNKFMGSGMLPAAAYVTLEHEHILIFRKGGKRNFKSKESITNRRQSGYFWEERNNWFSDIWDFKGTSQKSLNGEARERTAAFPLELPLRIISMYSVYGDTVLDPFLGTGTTSQASVILGRNSIGVDIDNSFLLTAKRSLEHAVKYGNIHYWVDRLESHKRFVETYKKEIKHINVNLNIPVITSQEAEIKFLKPSFCEKINDHIEVTHLEFEENTLF